MFTRKPERHHVDVNPPLGIPADLGGRSTKDLLRILMARGPGRPKQGARRITQQDIIEMAAAHGHKDGLTVDEVLYIYCRQLARFQVKVSEDEEE